MFCQFDIIDHHVDKCNKVLGMVKFYVIVFEKYNLAILAAN